MWYTWNHDSTTFCCRNCVVAKQWEWDGGGCYYYLLILYYRDRAAWIDRLTWYRFWTQTISSVQLGQISSNVSSFGLPAHGDRLAPSLLLLLCSTATSSGECEWWFGALPPGGNEADTRCSLHFGMLYWNAPSTPTHDAAIAGGISDFRFRSASRAQWGRVLSYNYEAMLRSRSTKIAFICTETRNNNNISWMLGSSMSMLGSSMSILGRTTIWHC